MSKPERASDPHVVGLEAENKALREDLEVVTRSKAPLEEENLRLFASNSSDSQKLSILAKELADLPREMMNGIKSS